MNVFAVVTILIIASICATFGAVAVMNAVRVYGTRHFWSHERRGICVFSAGLLVGLIVWHTSISIAIAVWLMIF
jgi:hypothetical protein